MKLRKALLGALMGLLMVAGRSALAANTQQVKVYVIMQKISVSVDNYAIDFSTVAEGYVGIHGTTVVVTNDGNINETMELDGGTAPGAWTKVANDAPGLNEYDIRAVFAAELGPLVVGDFTSADDSLTSSPVPASATQFTKNGSGYTGLNVPHSVTNTRNLFIQFRAPSSNTDGYSQKTITVTVTAIAGS